MWRTFVPILKGTCGSYSRYKAHYDGSDRADGCRCGQDDIETVGNGCSEQLQDLGDDWKIKPRTIRGQAIMVLVDCTTNEPLRAEKQDPIFNWPGVALPSHRSDTAPVCMQELTKFCTESNSNPVHFIAEDSAIDCEGGHDGPSMQACLQGLADLRNKADADWAADPGTEDWLNDHPDCSIHFKFDAGNEGHCQFSYLEFAIAANGLVSKCRRDEDLTVQGHYPMVSKDNKCKGKLKFCKNTDKCIS